MTTFVTRQVDPHEVLADAIAEAGSIKALSEKHGISGSYISNVKRRRKGFGQSLLVALQVVKKEVYLQTTVHPTFVNTVLGEPWQPPVDEGDE